MWEAIESLNHQTIFRGYDAVGRKCYAVTSDRNGMSVTPSCYIPLYTLAEARKQAREDLDAVPYGC